MRMPRDATLRDVPALESGAEMPLERDENLAGATSDHCPSDRFGEKNAATLSARGADACWLTAKRLK